MDEKYRILLVKLDIEYSKRFILLSLRKLKGYEKTIYISKQLNHEEQVIEKDCLHERRALLKCGIDEKQIRIRNFTLQQEFDKIWVDVQNSD